MRYAEAWANSWRVPDRRPIYEWAADGNIYLGPAYRITGPFRIEISRWLIEPFDALQDDRVRSVTIIAPVRSGKSLIADIWIPSVIARDPGPIMWNLQTDDLAKTYAEERIHPLLKHCPALQDLWPIERSHASTQRIIFRNGVNLHIQGPSLHNLQTRGIRYQVNDEAWIWKAGRLAEAEGRLGDFEIIGASKVLNLSQGSVEGDDMCQRYRAGDQRNWEIPCAHCGHWQLPSMSAKRPDGSRHGLRFDIPERNQKDGRALSELVGQVLPTIRYECEECGQAMEDSERTRSEWNRLGRFRKLNEKAAPGKVSFRWSGLLTRKWSDLVVEFLGAMDAYRGGWIEPLTAFVQKRVPDFWSDARMFDEDPVRQESFDVRAKWEAEEARLFTVDRQTEGLMYGLIHAWSRSEGTRRLWFGKLYSETEIIAKQNEFGIKPHQVLLDAGFEPRVVYGMCVRNGWVALKGDPVQYFLHPIKNAEGRVTGQVRRSTSAPMRGDPEFGKGSTRRKYAYLIRFSHPSIQERLQRILDGRGCKMVVPKGGDPAEERDYQKQLRSEYVINKRNTLTGAVKRIWVCPTGYNHYRDCTAMQVAGATLLNILDDDLELTDGNASDARSEAAS